MNYTDKIKEYSKKTVRNWTGKIGELDSLKLKELTFALNDTICEVGNGITGNNPVVPLVIQEILSKKLVSLAQNPEAYPLQCGHKVKQIYWLVYPKSYKNQHILFVYTDKNALGVIWSPEDGTWAHGHYNLTQEEAENYIKEHYGSAIKLLEE